MTNWRGFQFMTLAIVAIAMIGATSIPQNAYAGLNGDGFHCSEGETSTKAPPVITSVIPTLDGAIVEGTQAELDGDFFGIFHLLCAFPEFFEIEVVEGLGPVVNPFLFKDETIPGGSTFEYTLIDLECDTVYSFQVDGLWTSFFFGGRHINSETVTFTTLECEPEEEEGKPNGGLCTNCQHPTIGIDHRGMRVVDGGITVNGVVYDAERYHTPMPLIQMNLNERTEIILKISDDRLDNIKRVQLGFGMGKIGESFSQVEHSIFYDRNMLTDEVTITHDKIFKNVVVKKVLDKPCKEGGVPCTVIKFSFFVTEAIVGDVVFGTDIWDKYNNASTDFFNEGMSFGNQSDVIIEPVIDTTVIKQQLRTDDGYGNIDKRYSEAFAKKADWNMEQILKIVAEKGY